MNSKKLLILVCFSLIFGSFNLFLTENCRADGNEIYVDISYHGIRDGSPEKPWNSIQDAIDEAEEGDTIYVFGGLYDENLVIDKTVTLWGSIEGEETIIDSSDDLFRYTIEITADHFEMIDFTIRDNSSRKSFVNAGLFYLAGDNIIIQGNNITNSNYSGIYISPDASGCVISGNNFNNLREGIKIESSSTNDIVKNIFSNCSIDAISALSSDNNRIYGNNISNATYGLDIDKCNEINISNNIIFNCSYSGIYLSKSDNAIIKNNYLHNNTGENCIYLLSSDCKIDNNTFRHNNRAINIKESNNLITNNNIVNSSTSGINIYPSGRNNIIYLNKFINNTKSAQDDGNNIWFYNENGNYWSDYDNLDRNQNGIGDVFYEKYGILDEYPLGFFLKPPYKPEEPDPEDLETGVGLKITLKVDVEDKDSEELTVYFYNAETDELIDVDKKVLSGETAVGKLTLGFNTTYAWYAIVNDSRQENKSDPWIFFTKTTPPNNEPPVADAGGPYEAGPGEIINFDGSSSYDTDGEIDFYRWNFGDGTSEILAESPEHSFKEKGAYKVTLTVIDNDGTTDSEIIFVTIGDYVNKKPTANHGGPYVGIEEQKINFTGLASTDVDGIITNYSWSFGDGLMGYGETTSHKYEDPGNYILELTVIDNIGDTDITSTIVTVEEKPGIPGFELFIFIIAGMLLLIFRKNKNK